MLRCMWLVSQSDPWANMHVNVSCPSEDNTTIVRHELYACTGKYVHVMRLCLFDMFLCLCVFVCCVCQFVFVCFLFVLVCACLFYCVCVSNCSFVRSIDRVCVLFVRSCLFCFVLCSVFCVLCSVFCVLCSVFFLCFVFLFFVFCFVRSCVCVFACLRACVLVCLCVCVFVRAQRMVREWCNRTTRFGRIFLDSGGKAPFEYTDGDVEGYSKTLSRAAFAGTLTSPFDRGLLEQLRHTRPLGLCTLALSSCTCQVAKHRSRCATELSLDQSPHDARIPTK